MILKETIIKILEISINAPSGSNSQPWSFKVEDNEIFVFAHPEKDHPILNFRNRGTWMAHGALVENIRIAAGAFGLKSAIKIFPDTANSNLTAQIKLSEGLPTKEDLFQVIPNRASNRKKYCLKRLPNEQRKYLAESEREIGGDMKIVWIEDRSHIEKLGKAAAANEIVTLENQKLHEMFFDEIVWTQKEEQKKRKGLFIKTMGLITPEEFFLRLFKQWSIMRMFVKLGFTRKIAASNARNYSAVPLIGLLVLKNDDKQFLNAGRLIERIWLKTARLGLGFHLITGTMFYWQGIAFGKEKLLSQEHRGIIKNEYKIITDIAGINNNDKVVGALLRIGVADEPSAFSSKKQPEIKFI